MTLALMVLACKPPPEAPEGLDAASSYMVRNFYAADDVFQAGVQGFMNWYYDEGIDLVGQNATSETTESFTVGDLGAEDVALKPLSEEILLDPETDEWGPRDLTRSKGVVSLAEMDCPWTESEQYLLRPDQDTVFAEDWEGYDRTYVSSRAAYEQGSADDSYDPIEEDLDPFTGDFDTSAYEQTVLFTENEADPSKVLTADLEAYTLYLDFRHGLYELEDETIGMFAIVTYMKDAVWDESGKNGLLQTYSVEINAQQEDRTLRMLAVWAEPVGLGIDPDDPLVLTYAVNKSLDSSNRLSALCAGEEVEGE